MKISEKWRMFTYLIPENFKIVYLENEPRIFCFQQNVLDGRTFQIIG